MDVQTIFVALLFVAALAYIFRLVYRAVSVKSGGCASNCKCGVDFSNINPQEK